MSKLQVDDIVNKDDTGSAGFSKGAVVTGIVTATGGSFSGNVSVGGTLTYEDVTNVDSIGIITARSGVDASGANVVLGLSAGSSDDRLKFHTSEIYQDTSSFKIISNTGGIVLRGGGTNAWSSPTGTEDYIVAIQNGSVDLYYDNSKKLETTTSGVTVTGAVSDSIGPLRRLGTSNEGSSRNLAASDAGKFLRITAGSVALAVPSGTFTAGDMITFFNVSTGDITITSSAVTVYNSADGDSGNTRTIAAKGMATLVCTASDEFAISGSQLT